MPGLNTLRHAVRTLAHSPLFAVTSIASLALGIAASSTIFSMADALFLRPRPGLVNESRLVDVGRTTDGQGFDNFGYQVLLALREARLLDGIAGYRFDPGAVSLDNGRGGSERAFAAVVTANYFDVLGTRPAAGRFFRADEDEVPDAVPVVVLEHAFWTRRFGASPDVVGQTIRVNGRPYGVVGVAEPGFHGSTVTGTDMWMPFAMAPHITGRPGPELLTAHGPVWHLAVARLKPGVSMTQARDELNALLAPLKSTHPDAYGRWSMALLPSARIPGEFRTPVLTFVGILFVLTGMVLAIACTNVAGMLLARAMGRRREMATRLAVGASRGQLVVQLLAETLVLFVAAAAASLLLTWWMIRLLLSFMPSLPLPIHVDLEVNLRMFAFATGTALLTALVFGLAPALRATRVDLAQSLHGQHCTSDRRRFQLRHLLVGAQVALSLVLLVTTGLFVRALQSAAQTDTGYDMANVRVFTIETTLAGYRDQRAVALADTILERTRALSGVESVATSRMIPLQGGGLGLGGLRVPGYTSARGDERFAADWDVVSPGFFQTLGMTLVGGRAFSDADREGQPFVAIVNETFAALAWPGRDARGPGDLSGVGGTRCLRPAAHHRRRGTERTLSNRGGGPASVHLRAAGPAADDRAEPVCEACARPSARRGNPAAGGERRSGAAGHRQLVTRGSGGSRVASAAPGRSRGRRRRCRRPAAHRARDLWPDGVPGGPTIQGNRGAHGPGRHPRECAVDDAGSGRQGGGGRIGGGSAAGRRGGHRRARAARGGSAAGPRVVPGGRGPAWPGVADGVSRACPSRGGSKSGVGTTG